MGFQITNPGVAAETIKKLSKQLISWSFDQFILDFKHSPFELSLEWREKGKRVCGFTLVQQVNCCGILVSTRTFVTKDYEKQGIAQALMPLKEAIATEFGYSCLMATVNVSGNPAEVHILTKFGWKKGDEFVNRRTNNTVAVFTKSLT